MCSPRVESMIFYVEPNNSTFPHISRNIYFLLLTLFLENLSYMFTLITPLNSKNLQNQVTYICPILKFCLGLHFRFWLVKQIATNLFSCCCCCCLVTSVMSNFVWPYGLYPTRLLCPWNFPGKNTEEGCHALLQGILPTQGSNPSLFIAGRFFITEPLGKPPPLSKVLLTVISLIPLTCLWPAIDDLWCIAFFVLI